MKLTADTIELSVVTSNLMHYQDLSAVGQDCQWVIDNFYPDLWGVQEAYSYAPVLSALPDYALAVPENLDPKLGRNRILYNTKFLELVSIDAVEMHPTVAGEYALRMVAVGHFRDVFDGNDIWFFNTHLDPGIEAGGKPVLPSTKTAASIKMIADFAPMVTAKSVGSRLAFWGGDLNVDEFADDAVNDARLPNKVFHDNGLLSIYDELDTAANFDTAGTRTIDVIGRHARDGRVRAVSVERSPGRPTLHSDHRFVKGVYNLQRLPPT